MKTSQKKYLLFCSIAVAGYTYSIDVLQALEVPLRRQPYSFTTLEFNLLYIFTFIPISILDIPIGIAIDRISLKGVIMLCLGISLISELIFTLMLQYRPNHYFVVLLMMRSFFGVCGEGSMTALSLIFSKYCKENYELISSYWIGIGFLFDSLDSLITTQVYNATNDLPLTLYITVIVCGVAFLSGFQLIRMISREHQHKPQQKIQKSILEQIKSFNSTFWFIIVLVFFNEGSLGPFNDNLNDLLVNRFSMPYKDAGGLLLIPFGGLSIFSIFVGLYLSKRPTHRRASFILSTSLYFFFMGCLYLLPNTENPTLLYYYVISLFLVSMSFCFAVFYSALCTSIAYVVEEQSLGTAWGILGTVIGLAEWTVPFVNSAIIDMEDDLREGYTNLTFFGYILCGIPILLSIWIYFGSFGILDRSLKEIQEERNRGFSTESLIQYYD